MKEKIEDLIKQQKMAKFECQSLLEELNQIDSSKLSNQETNSLEESKMRYLDEVYFRQLFIQDLETIL